MTSPHEILQAHRLVVHRPWPSDLRFDAAAMSLTRRLEREFLAASRDAADAAGGPTVPLLR